MALIRSLEKLKCYRVWLRQWEIERLHWPELDARGWSDRRGRFYLKRNSTLPSSKLPTRDTSVDKWNRWIYRELCIGTPIRWSHPISREDIEKYYRDLEASRRRADLAVKRGQFKARFGCRPTDELLEEYTNNLNAKSELRKLKKLLKGE